MASLAFLLIEGMIIAIAIRLLLLGRRSKGLPEKLIGSFFLAVALMVLFRALAMLEPLQASELKTPIFNLGNMAFCAAILILYMFTWRVFRPAAAWARWLVIIGSLLTIGCYLVRMWVGEEHAGVKITLSGIRVIPFLWAFLETTRYYRMMRRRERIGMGDPVVANRFLLWAIWTGSVSLLPLFVLVVRIFLYSAGVEDPWNHALDGQGAQFRSLMLVMQTMLLGAAIAAIASLWLSFFPPASYLRRLRGGSGQEVA